MEFFVILRGHIFRTLFSEPRIVWKCGEKKVKNRGSLKYVYNEIITKLQQNTAGGRQ